jgi:phosphoglycolate phosphatase
MVGDAITDIAVARAAGLAVVAVDFGYSETPVAALGPDRIVSGFDRLPEVVFALLAAQETGQETNLRRKLIGDLPYTRHT